MNIPSTAQDLTPTWLTEALQQSVLLNGTEVVACERQMLDGGITGQIVRLRLTYNVGDESAPCSLIAKMSAADPELRESLKNYRMYEREVRFYQKIADQIALSTPRCYYSDLDLETNTHILLLEDLAPARSRALHEACSLPEAEAAIRQIAEFHATWWESPQLADKTWLQPSGERGIQYFQESVQARWPTFLDKVGDRFPAELRPIGQRVTENVIVIHKKLLQPPQTIAHADYKLDNLFFTAAQEEASSTKGLSCVVTDWQLISLSRGVFDVAFFLSSSISISDYQANGSDLLKLYHMLLLEHGVRDYSFEQCLVDYGLANLFSLARRINVIGGGNLSPALETAFCDIWLPRLNVAIAEYDAMALLADLVKEK